MNKKTEYELGRIEFGGKHYLSDEVYLTEINATINRINKKLDENDKMLVEILKLLKAKSSDRITVNLKKRKQKFILRTIYLKCQFKRQELV